MIKRTILSLVRYLTLPFALLYGVIIFIRNKFYDWGFSTGLKFTLPMISVGNLSVGGTGKSPHTEYLINLLHYQYQLATLSRGYKRKSRGFVLADDSTTAIEIGDEPMQFKLNYPDIEVCVCEDRIMAVPQLLQRKPDVQVIVLDDAFQHRSIQPSLNILITDSKHLYTNDYILPFGRLREFRKGANRADIIIVSKCDDNFTDADQQKIKKQLAPNSNQHLFFSKIIYKNSYHLFTNQETNFENKDIVIVSGIANNESLLQHIRTKTKRLHLLGYRDHQYFTTENIEEIITAYNNLANTNKCIVTTQKDATRLLLHKQTFINANIDIIVLPIEIDFLFDQAQQFNNLIMDHLQTYYPAIPQVDEVMHETEFTTNTNNYTNINYIYTNNNTN